MLLLVLKHTEIRIKTTKWKSLKKRNHKVKMVKKIQNKYNIRQLCFETLLLALHYYSGDNVKYGILAKHLLQRKH